MKRVGLIIPNSDTTLERDFQRNLVPRVSLHAERVWLESVTVAAEERMLSEEVPRAVEYLRPLGVDAAVFGCTSAGAIRGVIGENEFCEWLRDTLDCPVVSAFGSVRRNLAARSRGTRTWLVSPYSRAVHETMIDCLEAAGLTVIDGASMGLESDIEIGRLGPEEIIGFVERQRLSPEPDDCVFVSCTNLRAAECAGELSQRLGCAATTSNLAMLEELESILQPEG